MDRHQIYNHQIIMTVIMTVKKSWKINSSFNTAIHNLFNISSYYPITNKTPFAVYDRKYCKEYLSYSVNVTAA